MYKGEDKVIEIAITDENDAAIDLSAFAGIIVEVYEQIGQPIAKFSLNASAGFDSLANVNNPAGTFEVNLKREVVEKYLRKKLLGEVKVRETNPSFTDSKFVSISDPFEIDTLKLAQTSSEDVP